jgi:hypothetical protein
MSRSWKALTLAVLAFGFVTVAVAEHHEPTIYVWINFVKAKPGQSQALTSLLIDQGTKSYDPLIESGSVVEWGVGMPVVHDGGDAYSHVEWVVFPGWAGVDGFMAAFMASRQQMSPEEMQAMDEQWDSVVVDGSHSDDINRSVHIGRTTGERISYIHLAYFKARPGKEGAASEMFTSDFAPVYDQLMTDGKIINYGLHAPALHRDEEWTYMAWYSSSGLVARDEVRAAFAARDAERSEEELAQWWDKIMQNFEMDHEDQIIMVVHHKSGVGASE